MKLSQIILLKEIAHLRRNEGDIKPTIKIDYNLKKVSLITDENFEIDTNITNDELYLSQLIKLLQLITTNEENEMDGEILLSSLEVSEIRELLSKIII